MIIPSDQYLLAIVSFKSDRKMFICLKALRSELSAQTDKDQLCERSIV